MLKKAIGRVLCLSMMATVMCMPLNVTAASWITSTDNEMYQYQIVDDESCVFRIRESQNVTMETLVVPDSLDGYTVTSLFPFAYQMSHIKAKNLVVPNTIKSIGEYALDTEFENLYLPEGLETISYYVTFYCNTALKEVVIPTTVTSIERYAFGWHGASSVNGTVGGSEQVEDFTVYSYGNDIAKAYAESEGYTYVDLSEYAPGDMDLDNTVTMKDVMALYQMGAGQTFGSPVHHVMGDYVDDDAINMKDVLTLYKSMSGSTV